MLERGELLERLDAGGDWARNWGGGVLAALAPGPALALLLVVLRTVVVVMAVVGWWAGSGWGLSAPGGTVTLWVVPTLRQCCVPGKTAARDEGGVAWRGMSLCFCGLYLYGNVPFAQTPQRHTGCVLHSKGMASIGLWTGQDVETGYRDESG